MNEEDQECLHDFDKDYVCKKCNYYDLNSHRINDMVENETLNKSIVIDNDKLCS